MSNTIKRQSVSKYPKCFLMSTDEDGEAVHFDILFAAIFYGTDAVTAVAETRIDISVGKLLEKAFEEIDRSDVLIHSLEDKIEVVNRLRKKCNRWIR